jgi:nicotinate dehydrogenase FAD-subunit
MDTRTRKIPKFEYACAESLSQAIQLLNDSAFSNRVLAGGTDLIISMRGQKPDFNRLVGINRLSELKVIQKVGQTIFVGAGVTFAETMENEILQKSAPVLVKAAHSIGSPQIRNLGTIGGNVANAASCADSLPALMCLDAIAHLCSSQGEREIPVTHIVVGPNQTLIKPGEILTRFSFYIPPEGVKTSLIKLARRNAQAISRLTVAVMGGVDGNGRIHYARISLGAVTPQPIRFPEIENQLTGQVVSPELLSRTALRLSEAVIAATGRRWSSEYKERAVSGLVERALTRTYLG